MKRMPAGLLALLTLLALVGLHIAWLAPLLPETVAAHFGPDGPNNWTSRTALLLSYALVNLGFVALLVVPILFLNKIPESLINLPHKDYWLAPQRRGDTQRIALGLISEMAAATVLLCMVAFHDVATGSLPRGEVPGIPGSFWMWLLAYLAFTGVWVVRLMRRFGRPGA